MYIRSRAGLVALVFIQISISLVSAVPLPNPIPTLQSGLPSSTLLSRDNPRHDNTMQLVDDRKILSMAQMSSGPNAMRALTRRNDNMDDAQLVRRTSTSTKIKQGFQKMEQDIKHVAQKLRPEIDKGAKVVKFGLKVAQTVSSVAAKAVSFNPELGKPLQQAIAGYSQVAGAISDHIPVKLPPKLQKGENIMDTANKVMSAFPRDVDEQDFQQRDIGDVYYFEES